MYKGKDLPCSIGIEINSYCNRTCYYCPREKNRKEKLSNQIFYPIIHQLKDWDFKGHILLNVYNEPLTDKRLIEFVNFIRGYGFKIRLYTNGDFLNESIANRLKVNEIRVTIHEPTSNKQVLKLKALKKKYKNITLIDLRDKFRKTDLLNRGDSLKGEIFKTKKCSLVNMMIVKSNGDVTLCCNDIKSKYIFGNVYNEKLKDIWNKKSFKETRDKIRKGIFELDICKKCGYLK